MNGEIKAFENFKFDIGDVVELVVRPVIPPPPVGMAEGFAIIPAQVEQRFIVLNRILIDSPAGICKKYLVGGTAEDHAVHEIEITKVI